MTSHIRERLSAYLDGELPPEEETLATAHLRDCPDCSRLLEELATVDDLARERPLSVPEGYFESFPARVRAALPRQAKPRRVPFWALAAAASLLVAIIVPITLRETAESPSVAPAGPAARLEETRVPEAPPATLAAPAASRASGAPTDKLKALGYVRQADEKQQAAKDELKANASARRDSDAGGSGGAVPSADVRPQASAPAPAAVAPEVPAAASAAQKAPSQAARARGPWSQNQAANQTGFAPPPEEVDAKKADQVKAQAPPEAETRTAKPAARGAELEGAEGLGRPKGRLGAEQTLPFEALSKRRAATPADARRLREDWRAFLREQPDHPRAGEAWVALVDAGVRAWELGGDPEDRRIAEVDGAQAEAVSGETRRIRQILDRTRR